ncbi:MAG: hypothetical protein WAT39_18170 [Planctomycetota bacterium]
MDALQFTLFFVALVLGYVLVHLRMVRCERHLQQLAGIRNLEDQLRALDERLAKLAAAFDQQRLERIEHGVDRLHDDLEDLREATADVRAAVVQIPPPIAITGAGTPAEPVVVPPARRLLDLVEGRLLQLGYHEITVLSDLRAADVTSEIEVLVECWQGAMPAKGRVLVKNGSVRDVAVQTVATMFP